MNKEALYFLQTNFTTNLYPLFDRSFTGHAITVEEMPSCQLFLLTNQIAVNIRLIVHIHPTTSIVQKIYSTGYSQCLSMTQAFKISCEYPNRLQVKIHLAHISITYRNVMMIDNEKNMSKYNCCL